MYNCERCNKSYKSKKNLISHLQKNEPCMCKNKKISRSSLLRQLGGYNIHIQQVRKPCFEIICLGAYGGISSGNSSCYILRFGNRNWFGLDGGSVADGVWKYNSFVKDVSTLSLPQKLVCNGGGAYQFETDTINPSHYRELLSPYTSIKNFVISHSHLDHSAGLVAMSPALFGKNVKLYSHKHIVNNFREFIFNDYIFPAILYDIDKSNSQSQVQAQANKGPITILGVAKNYNQEFLVDNEYSVLMMPVEHGLYGTKKLTRNNSAERNNSSVYFVECQRQFIMYFGDVSNVIDFDNKHSESAVVLLKSVFNKCVDYVENGKELKGILLECANKNNTPLFGHLDAIHYIQVLKILDKICQERSGNSNTSKKMKISIFVTHIKPPYAPDTYLDDFGMFIKQIQSEFYDQLQKEVCRFQRIQPEFIFPLQGAKYVL